MLEIDGSMGEGGGSVLRLSLALASVKKEPIRIFNIRANRSKPGLANQHLSALEALAELTNAEVEGAEIESEEVVFRPDEPEGGRIEVDIGTAGSTTLILQAMMIPAAFAKKPLELEVKGGTDNPFAPPIDYLKNVTLPMLRKMGYQGKVECVRRGHYPKGGGKISAEIRPVEALHPITLTNFGEVDTISGRSHCVKLPDHIAKRQANSAEERLKEAGYDSDIKTEYYEKSEDPHLSPGTGIVLWAKSDEGSILGSNALGEKGKPAEKVGKEAADELIKQIRTGKAVDLHMSDQILPYMALAPGKSEITSTELTSHTLTNLSLLEKILAIDFDITGDEGEPGRIRVEGSPIS